MYPSKTRICFKFSTIYSVSDRLYCNEEELFVFRMHTHSLLKLLSCKAASANIETQHFGCDTDSLSWFKNVTAVRGVGECLDTHWDGINSTFFRNNPFHLQALAPIGGRFTTAGHCIIYQCL